MTGPLPAPPDFEELDALGAETAVRQAPLLIDLGAMGLAWANNESVLIYVLMILLRTDEVCAAVVFSTLNTTRARVDLVRRLARIKITDADIAQTLNRIIRKFEACTAVRNELNHCVFSIDERGDITQTRSLRVEERKGSLSLGALRPIDAARRKEIQDVNRTLKRLNRELWAFLPVLKTHCDGRSAGGS